LGLRFRVFVGWLLEIVLLVLVCLIVSESLLVPEVQVL
jgi:hypothetical protein